MSQSNTAAFEALQMIAETDGLVRVLVQVATPDQASSGDPSGAIDQSKMVLQSALPLDDAPLAEPIEGQPIIVMEVSPRGLEFLNNSPLVARIEADGLIGIPPIIDDATQSDDSPSFGGGGTGDLSAPQSGN